MDLRSSAPTAAGPDSVPHWTAPGSYEISPGVFRIPLPLPEGPPAINVYAVADGDDVVLIDSGWATEDGERHLVQGLERIGFEPSGISRFLITHWHTDHYSQALEVRRRHGTPISLGVGERATVESHAAGAEAARVSSGAAATLARAGAHDMIAMMHGVPDVGVELPDHWLEGNPRIVLRNRTLVAIPTPGHTNGHYSFWDPGARLFFTGDHVLPRITPWIGLETAPGRLPLGDYLASLLLVQTMPDAQLLPAHGPTMPSAATRARQLIDHHHGRLDRTLDAVSSHGVTAIDVAHRLRWTRRDQRLGDLPAPLRPYAVIETVAHLDVLVDRGAVQVAESDGVALYSR
ncbi:MBL fold metallo-hydrolase [Prescottella equi]|uniref:MBL fold metallo-hydrolase n=1 Tax=Rhodococcus hoagii TaxID=43767 RepID=UPI003D9A004E